MNRKKITTLAIIVLYGLFIAASFIFEIQEGKKIAANFLSFAITMLKILPCVFILIGLFEVWVKKETVQKHLGEESGVRGFIWALLLAGTTVGTLIVALPIASSLYKKGAKLSIVLTYISAATICRVPMTLFEVSYLGLKFTLIRLITSIILVITTSILLGNYLTKKKYTMPNI